MIQMGIVRISPGKRATGFCQTGCKGTGGGYNDLKEAARDLRRTRALCKFNGGKERRRAVPQSATRDSMSPEAA